MIATNSKPSECLIIEDSHVGRVAATESGGRLLPIKKLTDVNYKIINKSINENLNENVKKMWGLGTPEDLDFFIKKKILKTQK